MQIALLATVGTGRTERPTAGDIPIDLGVYFGVVLGIILSALGSEVALARAPAVANS